MYKSGVILPSVPVCYGFIHFAGMTESTGTCLQFFTSSDNDMTYWHLANVTKEKCVSRRPVSHSLSLLSLCSEKDFLCVSANPQQAEQCSVTEQSQALSSNIYLHNGQWVVKLKRCSSIMTQIGEIHMQMNLLLFTFANACAQ